jgi:hypothetical protein
LDNALSSLDEEHEIVIFASIVLLDNSRFGLLEANGHAAHEVIEEVLGLWTKLLLQNDSLVKEGIFVFLELDIIYLL